jgi:hypothetical protein
MADDRSGSAARGRESRSIQGRRRVLPALTGFALAALAGGIVGGLVVRATWSPDNGSAGSEPSGAAACRAANVADHALPSVVTVRASGGGRALTMTSGDTIRLAYERHGTVHTTLLTLTRGEAG